MNRRNFGKFIGAAVVGTALLGSRAFSQDTVCINQGGNFWLKTTGLTLQEAREKYPEATFELSSNMKKSEILSNTTVDIRRSTSTVRGKFGSKILSFRKV